MITYDTTVTVCNPHTPILTPGLDIRTVVCILKFTVEQAAEERDVIFSRKPAAGFAWPSDTGSRHDMNECVTNTRTTGAFVTMARKEGRLRRQQSYTVPHSEDAINHNVVYLMINGLR